MLFEEKVNARTDDGGRTKTDHNSSIAGELKRGFSHNDIVVAENPCFSTFLKIEIL